MIANILGPDLGIVLVLILVVLVGGSQLPKLARNLGLAGKEFRKAHDEAMADKPATASAAAVPVAPPVAQFAPAPTPVVPAAAATIKAEDQVTLSRSDLEALLAERDARVKPESNS